MEPGWINGDDYARGIIDACPRCDEMAWSHGYCTNCGADEDGYYDGEEDNDYEFTD